MAIGSVYDNGNAIILLIVAALGVVFIANAFATKIDAREPPVVHSRIPFIGHIIGMVREGAYYFKRLDQRSHHPISTLPMLNGRMYIVSSPELANQIQKASSTLDLEQLAIAIAPRLVGISRESQRILDDPKHKEEGRERFSTTFLKHDVRPLLGPNQIGDISAAQLQSFCKFINDIPVGLETNLYNFVIRETTIASASTFYGPENPFAVHPELVDEFWNWESGVIGYMMGIFPQWTARRAYTGLEKVAKGFTEYINKGGQAQAYELLQRHINGHEDVGISRSDQGRMEVPMCLGFFVNAAIASFWILNNIFSRPSLLAEIRDEVQTNAIQSPNTISYSGLKESCPLLNSVFRETLRIVGSLSTSRYVLDDTLVADTYLLRKDSIVQILGGTLHADKEIWGPDADSFNPRRFYYTPNGSKTSEEGAVSGSKSSQIHPAAFRGFGGGSSLCPGRHFAQMEVVSLAAALVMGFDMEPPRGEEKVLWDPPLDDKRFIISLAKPKTELRVKLNRRKGMEDIQWTIQY